VSPLKAELVYIWLILFLEIVVLFFPSVKLKVALDSLCTKIYSIAHFDQVRLGKKTPTKIALHCVKIRCYFLSTENIVFEAVLHLASFYEWTSFRWRQFPSHFLLVVPRIIESQNISSWKGPTRIIESNSLLLVGLPKNKPYD